MTPPPLWVDSTLVLDARRVVWLPLERTLLVADLHLGYNWVHRTAGNLLPVAVPDETAARLLAVVADYQPQRIVLLGDIVHRAIVTPPMVDLLTALLNALQERAETVLIAGNHDRALAGLLTRCDWKGGPEVKRECGPHLLLHGEESDAIRAAAQLLATTAKGGRVFIGHEHPAITISNGVASSAKCPCFLLTPHLVVLPAFSPWAAGTSVRQRRWLSGYTQAANPKEAVAIVGRRLLPIRF